MTTYKGRIPFHLPSRHRGHAGSRIRHLPGGAANGVASPPKKRFSPKWKKAGYVVFSLLLTLVLSAVVGTLLVLHRPQILINKKNLDRFLVRYPLGNVAFAYESFSFEIREDRGLFKKKVALNMGGIRASYPPKIRELTVPKVSITLAYDLFHEGFVTEFGPGEIVVKNFVYEAPPGKASSGYGKNLRERLVPERFRTTDFGDFSFDVEKFKIIRKKMPDLSGGFSARIASAGKRLETLTAQGWTKETKGLKRTYSGTLRVNPAFDEWGGSLEYSRGETKLKLVAELDKSRRLSGETSFSTAAASGDISFTGREEDGNYPVSGEGGVRFSRKHAPRIALERCSGNFRPDKDVENVAFHLGCDVNATFPSFDASASLGRGRKIPYGKFHVEASSKRVSLTDFSKPASFHVALKTRPDGGIIDRRIEAELDLKGPLASFPESLDVKGRMGLEIDVNEFAELVSYLRDTPLAVPAPFNVMGGRAEISARGRIESLEKENEFSYETTLDLSSPQQRLNLSGKGTARVGIKTPSFAPELAVEVGESAIMLPPLNAASVPQLLPDSRIRTKPPREKGPFLRNYDVTVKSRPGTAFLVKQEHAARGAPLTFDLRLTPGSTSGTISAQSFEAEFFRTKARILKFDLKLAKELRKSGLDGLIEVDRAPYLVSIGLLGSFERPRVILESDPPLTEEDIVSLLLYGDTFSDLGEGDAQDAKDVRSGISQRAFALGSLFMFASTPVQKVSYDPYTKTVEVKFRLGKGSALSLKNQSDVHGVSYQHSLGKNWLIKTEVETTFDAARDESKKTKKGAFIEWFKRY